jgi:hypothetical protein
LISAIISAPPVSKALAQANIVFSISIAHSTSSSVVQSGTNQGAFYNISVTISVSLDTL